MQSSYQPIKTVKVFFQSISNAYNNQNQSKLVQLFKEFYFLEAYMLSQDNWKVNISFTEYSLMDSFGSSFGKIVQLMKQFQIKKMGNKWKEAFQTHMKIIIAILKCLEQVTNVESDMMGTNQLWICKPLRIILRATKKIFFWALKDSQMSTASAKLKNDLLNTLQRYKAARALNSKVKNQILPLVDNLQVSILFSFHNYEQINRILSGPKIYGNHGSKFRDNFLFQNGKYCLVNENMKEAEQNFESINITTKGQKRLVLKYLIPCKIFLGKMFKANSNCPDEVFPEYDLLIESLVTANFYNYDKVVLRYQKIWIKRGIYLLMDRLRIIVWRNLLKRLYNIVGAKIDVELVQRAVILAGGNENINECICIVGNLIYEGYLKGYIFQDQHNKKLVLKKHDAFPSLSAIVQ